MTVEGSPGLWSDSQPFSDLMHLECRVPQEPLVGDFHRPPQARLKLEHYSTLIDYVTLNSIQGLELAKHRKHVLYCLFVHSLTYDIYLIDFESFLCDYRKDDIQRIKNPGDCTHLIGRYLTVKAY